MSSFERIVAKFLNGEATSSDLLDSLESIAPLNRENLDFVLTTLSNLAKSGHLDSKSHRELLNKAINLAPQTGIPNQSSSISSSTNESVEDDKTVFRPKSQPGSSNSNKEDRSPSSDPEDSLPRTRLSESSLESMESLQSKSGTDAEPDQGRSGIPSDSSAKASRASAWPTGGFSNEPSPTPTEGTTIKSRFVLEELIASGGMGMVFKARDLIKEEAQERNPYVALKVLNNSFKKHPDAYLALSREARKTQELAHPNIVNVFDFDRDKETVFMTMELLKGQGLDQALKARRHEGFPVEQALDYITQMSAALIHAHNKGVLHCDFKPNNVFLVGNDNIKVLDFGIAQANRTTIDEPVEQTRFDAKNLGALTAGYASREVHEGLDPEPSDDVFALACVAYQLLIGKHPYNNKPANTLLEGPEKLTAPEGFSRKQWKALQKGLAIKREDRTQSVQEFIDGLNPKGHLQVNLKLVAASVVAVSFVGLAYYVPIVINQNRINDLATEFLSEDLERVSTAIVTLGSFNESNRLELLDLVESELISFFDDTSNQISETAEAELFLPYLQQARSLYPESLTLSESEDYLMGLRDLEISNLIADFTYALDNNLITVSSGPGNIEELLTEVEQLDPQSPLLSDPRLLLRIQQQALFDAENGDIESARILVAFGLQKFPGNVSLIDTRDLVEMLASNSVSLAVSQSVDTGANGQGQDRARLDALLETPEFTSAWDNEIVGLRNSMLENRTLTSAEFEGLNARVGDMYVDQVAVAIQASRFNEASRLIISGKNFAPELDWPEQERLLAAGRAESIRAAEIEGLRYTVEAQLSAMQLAEARESLQALQAQQFDPDDPFLATSYIDLVERSRTLGNLQDAMNYVADGLAYLPESGELLNLQSELRLTEVRELISAYFVNQSGSEDEIRQLLVEARTLAPDDHNSFVTRLSGDISETLTRLDSSSASDRLQSIKELLPELGNSLDEFVQPDSNQRIETLAAVAVEYASNGRVELAIANYQMIQELDAEHVRGHELLIEISDWIVDRASALYDDAQYEEAIELLDSGIAMQPPNLETLEQIKQDSQSRLDATRRRVFISPF